MSGTKFNADALKDEDSIWSFAYGSNMDVESVEAKKGIKVLGMKKKIYVISHVQSNIIRTRFSDSTPAVLKDYRLYFNIRAMKWVEPSFANVKKEDGKEVHGVAVKMTVAGMKRLDSQASASPM